MDTCGSFWYDVVQEKEGESFSVRSEGLEDTREERRKKRVKFNEERVETRG